jgi:LysM repeat protein
MQNEYHIDVTPEEDTLFREIPEQEEKEKTPSSNLMKNKIFWGVVFIHAALLTALTVSAAPQKDKTVPENIIQDDKVFVGENTPPQPLSSPEPTPEATPAPQSQAPMDGKPQPLQPPTKVEPKEVKKIITKPQSGNNLTKDYTIKSGDTVFSIAKKYKLNYDRLIKINGIKDPNKIKVGETLKFM